MITVIFWTWLIGCFMGALWCGAVWVESRLSFGSWPRLCWAEVLSIIAAVILFWPIVLIAVFIAAWNFMKKDKEEDEE